MSGEAVVTRSATVVIVTYNNAVDIDACIGSLLSETVRTVLEVVVIDNASTDDTVARVEALARDDDRIQVVANAENVGFAVACNQGARLGQADAVVLVNPDAVAHPGAIDVVVDVAARDGIGPVGGRTVDADGRADGLSVQNAPTLLGAAAWALTKPTVARRLPPRLARRVGRHFAILPAAELGEERPVPVVSGCLLAMSRSSWDALGGFDEAFFLYAEDVDLSLRASALGLQPTYTPDASVTHVGGASSSSPGRRRVLLLQGRTTIMRVHWRPASAAVGCRLLLTGVAIRALEERLRHTDEGWRHTLAARHTWLPGYPGAGARLTRR